MSLNVIGLISGGKDSLYSLVHCIENGHKVIALANLYPMHEGKNMSPHEEKDLDSFMYQTVGHSIIPLYAEALELPLYRGSITGTAVQTMKDYSSPGSRCSSEVIQGQQTDELHDETEDMYILIEKILKQLPEANAICAGAILSTYQRTRVESVATRLGLTPLAYLWQYPALPPPKNRSDSLTGLLDDMGVALCDARIIKIASGGIRASMLFANVTSNSCRSRLLEGLSRFHLDPNQEFVLRGAILGEGGEYETLALGGPRSLWKKRIQVSLSESVDEEGGISYARLTKASVEERDQEPDCIIPIPALLDKRFVASLEAIQDVTATSLNIKDVRRDSPKGNIEWLPSGISTACATLQISNLTAEGTTAADQLSNILHKLDVILSSPSSVPDQGSTHDASRQDLVSTTLLLQNIECFADVNRIYSENLWSSSWPIPPARVTVAAPLPTDTLVALSLTFDRNTTQGERLRKPRDGLHVQSRSYWAPSNIGPYSQAVSTPMRSCHPQSTEIGLKVVHVAGQIPLIPSSMQASTSTFVEQATLSLQHLWRIGQDRRVDLWAGAGVAYLAAQGSSAGIPSEQAISAAERASFAAMSWNLAFQIDEKGQVWACSNSENTTFEVEEESEDVDVWHLHHNRGFVPTTQQATVGEHLHVLPDYNILSMRIPKWARADAVSIVDDPSAIPTFLAVEVADLPRHAPIEWWSTGISELSREVGKQNCRVYFVKTFMSEDILMQGVAIEHYSIDDSDVRSSHFERQPVALTFFGTILMGKDIGEAQVVVFLTDLLSGILDRLTADASVQSSTISPTHTFISLAASTSTQNLVVESDFIQRSTIVPCHHLWSSSSYKDSAKEASRNAAAVPEMYELAAAIVFKLDVQLAT